MDAFRCGHEKTPENTERSGGTRTACRTCRRARRLTPAGRRDAAERMRRHRAGVVIERTFANTLKAECAKGHKYTPENTYIYQGSRQCISCRHARTTAYYHQKRTNGGEHTEEQWLNLCAANDYRCAHCARHVKLTRDHIIPVSRGGSNDIANIQPLCRPCNSGKKDRLILKEG